MTWEQHGDPLADLQAACDRARAVSAGALEPSMVTQQYADIVLMIAREANADRCCVGFSSALTRGRFRTADAVCYRGRWRRCS